MSRIIEESRAMISDGCLSTATQRPSPHYDDRPDPEDISLLVVHGISLPAGEFGGPAIDQLFMGTLDTVHDERFQYLHGVRVSAHCLIRRDGELLQYVPFHLRAWHAGKSHYAGRNRCNDYSIGIELEGTDHAAYTDSQYQVLAAVAHELLQHYPKLTAQRIVGHQHIAPVRKTDPGPAFDWAYFQQCLHRL
ncbi:1,6-anhydro-N-acetylmuramyl-L-alanine amidase AmpD [Pseudidiomarina mangrovi]|uniref:1,6-anhydro-N-acetylmuramyl-L-alanine amidase AmpD n=1 Tax=Pseudidiomarina mangrovi TaxID=2487133 RepID=UPI003D698D13